jgi:hypothetical protein
MGQYYTWGEGAAEIEAELRAQFRRAMLHVFT